MKKKVLVSVVLLCILAGCFIVFFSINKLKEDNLKGISMENFSDSKKYSEDEIKSVASKVVDKFTKNQIFENTKICQIIYEGEHGEDELLGFHIKYIKEQAEEEKYEYCYFYAIKKWYGWKVELNDCA